MLWVNCYCSLYFINCSSTGRGCYFRPKAAIWSTVVAFYFECSFSFMFYFPWNLVLDFSLSSLLRNPETVHFLHPCMVEYPLVFCLIFYNFWLWIRIQLRFLPYYPFLSLVSEINVSFSLNLKKKKKSSAYCSSTCDDSVWCYILKYKLSSVRENLVMCCMQYCLVKLILYEQNQALLCQDSNLNKLFFLHWVLAIYWFSQPALTEWKKNTRIITSNQFLVISVLTYIHYSVFWKWALCGFTNQSCTEVSTYVVGMFAFPPLAAQSPSQYQCRGLCFAGSAPAPGPALLSESVDLRYGILLHQHLRSFGSHYCIFPERKKKTNKKLTMKSFSKKVLRFWH